MKTRNILITALFSLVLLSVNAQEKTPPQQQLAPPAGQTAIEKLLSSGNFEFIANIMLPSGQAPKDLVGSNYSVTFTPEMIVSNLPFYGRSYSTIAMGKDQGMRFQGAPENFKQSKNKNQFEVKTEVKSERDTYKLLLLVSKSGNATLSIATNDRGIVNYQGEVVSIQK